MPRQVNEISNRKSFYIPPVTSVIKQADFGGCVCAFSLLRESVVLSGNAD